MGRMEGRGRGRRYVVKEEGRGVKGDGGEQDRMKI
jgi:hypothetical protein